MKKVAPISYFILKPKVILVIYAFALTAFIALTKVTVDVVEEVKQDIKEVNIKRVDYSKKYIETELSKTLSEIEVTLFALMSFVNALDSEKDADKFIDEMVDKYPRIRNLLIFDEYGESKHFPSSMAEINVADRDYFNFHKENPLSGLYMSDPFLGRMKGQLIFTLSISKLSNNNEFEGLYLAALKPQVFSEIYDYLKKEGFGVTIKSSRNGELYYGDNSIVLDNDLFYRDFTLENLPVRITIYDNKEDISLFSYTIKLLVKMKSYLIYWGLFSLLFGSVFIFSLRRQFQLSKQYRFASSHDYLTSAYNRRAFMEILNKECHRAIRYNNNLTLIMLDIDHFKKINDQYGHATGDKALIHLTDLLEKSIRSSDYLSRIGGEEFVILLPETDLAGALLSAEKYREKLEKTPLLLKDQKLIIRASFGVSYMESTEYSSADSTEHIAASLLEYADRQLYKAKETRNCVRPKI